MKDSIFKSVINLKNSKEFIELEKYYNSIRTLELFNYYGQENPHTAYLANLFKTDNPYTKDDFPFKTFLGLLSIAHEFKGNESLSKQRVNACNELRDIYFNIKEISNLNIKPQTKFGDSKCKPDITIEFSVEGQKYFIIVECKISSQENDKKEYNGKYYKQTELYRTIFEKNYEEKGYKAYYVFLSVSNENEIEDCENWIRISYQNLVDYVLYPCSIESNNTNVPLTIEEYINSYSNSYFKDNNKVLRLAITPREKELVKKIWESSHDSIKAILDILVSEKDNKLDKTNVEKIINQFYTDNALVLFSIFDILNKDDKVREKDITDSKMKKLKNNKPIYYFDNKPYYTIVSFIYAVLLDILNNPNIEINSFNDIPSSIIGNQYSCPRLALTMDKIDNKNKGFFNANRIDKYPLIIAKSKKKLMYAVSYNSKELKDFITDVEEEYSEYKNRIKPIEED